MQFKAEGHYISKKYGYQKMYEMVPLMRETSLIRKKLLPDVTTINLGANELGSSPILKSALEINNEQPLYLSISIQRANNLRYMRGSQTPFSFEEFMLFKQQQMAKITGEVVEGNASDIAALTQKMPSIEAEVKAEKDSWNKQPQNKYEKEVMSCINTGSFDQINHNVLVKIDNKNKTIFYKDPFGAPMPENISLYFQNHERLKSYQISVDTTQQQHPNDHCNCSLFTTANLITLSNHDSSVMPAYVRPTMEDYIPYIESTRADMIKIAGLDIPIEPSETKDSTFGM